jgi:hypothetical protein
MKLGRVERRQKSNRTSRIQPFVKNSFIKGDQTAVLKDIHKSAIQESNQTSILHQEVNSCISPGLKGELRRSRHTRKKSTKTGMSDKRSCKENIRMSHLNKYENRLSYFQENTRHSHCASKIVDQVPGSIEDVMSIP